MGWGAVHAIRWYDLHQTGGPEALADKPSRPDRVWNRIPGEVRGRIIDLALAEPELSPRELAVRFRCVHECWPTNAGEFWPTCRF